MEICLNKQEFFYCTSSTSIPERYLVMITAAHRKNETYTFELSDDVADDIRDLFGDQLQLVGFDEVYSPTQEGMILESLIDKFFIG